MNLGHHLTVRLQAFASYCMTHAEIKENTERKRERDVKENHIIIRTSFRKRASTDKTDFVKPEEHAHTQQRAMTYLDAKPRGQNRG